MIESDTQQESGQFEINEESGQSDEQQESEQFDIAEELRVDSARSEEVKFLHGDTHLPMFNFKDCGDCDLVSILLNPKVAIVCKHVALRCEKNVSFLIDTRSLKHPNDWKSDDLDSYHNLGRVSKGYFDISDEVCFLSKSRPSRRTGNTVQLKKSYWTHSVHHDFHRLSYELWSRDGKRGKIRFGAVLVRLRRTSSN